MKPQGMSGEGLAQGRAQGNGAAGLFVFVASAQAAEDAVAPSCRGKQARALAPEAQAADLATATVGTSAAPAVVHPCPASKRTVRMTASGSAIP